MARRPPPPGAEPVEELLHRAGDEVRETEEAARVVLGRHPRLGAVVRLATGVLREQSSEGLGLAASGAAFWLVISAFPTALAAVSLYGIFVKPDRVATDLGRLASAVPGSLGSLLAEQLRRAAAADHAGLSIGLAVSLVLALWSASAGVYNLDRAVRVAYGLPPQRFVEARARAMLGAFAVVAVLGPSALAASVFVARAPLFAVLLGAPIELAAITAAIGAMYRFSVGTKLGVRAALPGALTSAVGLVVVTAGFAIYVATSTRYAAFYGAFAGAVIGMIAIYFAVYVVLLGAVLNVQLTARRPLIS